jgi:hypothetical protein
MPEQLENVCSRCKITRAEQDAENETIRKPWHRYPLEVVGDGNELCDRCRKTLRVLMKVGDFEWEQFLKLGQEVSP